MKTKKKSGQILILVLLVVVVSLAIGLSVASRNLTNLRTSTQAEQSQRAFSAAEGGVENTLSKLNLVAQEIQTPASNASDCDVNAGVATCPLGTSAQGIQSSSNVIVTAIKSYERLVETGDVAQVNLADRAAVVDVNIKWALKSSTSEASPYKATLEFTFICTNDASTSCVSTPKTANAYGQHRVAYTVDTIPGQGSGFTACPNTSDTVYFCSVQFLDLPTNVALLRMKPFWNRTTINVSSPDANFPVQTYAITSTAVTDTGLSRKVEVKRDALPQLPAVFDYVLYSGRDIIK